MDGLARLALALYAAAAVWGFVVSERQGAAYALLAPIALSVLWQVPRLPPALVRVVERATWGVAAAVALFGLVWTLYPVVPPPFAENLPKVAGWLLALLAAALLLATPAVAPARGAIPAATGLLAASALDPDARLGAPLGAAAAAILLYLVFEPRAGDRPGAWRRRAVRAVPYVAVAGGIAYGIARFLPWAQPHVEQAAARVISPEGAMTAYSGLDHTSRLGEIEELSLSPRIVSRVWTSRPQHLRARVYTRFDGASWAASRAPQLPLVRVERETLPPPVATWAGTIPGFTHTVPWVRMVAGDGVRTRIVQESFNEGTLLAPPGVQVLQAEADGPRVDVTGALGRAPGVAVYGLLNDPGSLPAEPCAECLDVPEDTDARLRDLAARLHASAPHDAGRVAATSGYLERECRYSLKVGRFTSRQPVAEFVFEKKRGYCEYFASATAVLLRLQGIPARYVAGFNVTEAARVGGHYVVREADAHAWVDAYVPGRGWVEVDATPASQYDEVHAGVRSGFWAAAYERLRSAWADLYARLATGDWAAFGRWALVAVRDRLAENRVLVALVLLGAGAWAAGRFRRPRKAAALAERPGAAHVPQALADLVERVEADWSLRGFARPAARPPLEHVAAIPPGRVPTEWLDAGRTVVERYYRARFGGVAPTAAELEALRILLDVARIR